MAHNSFKSQAQFQYRRAKEFKKFQTIYPRDTAREAFE
jgi:hypothetical protein